MKTLKYFFILFCLAQIACKPTPEPAPTPEPVVPTLNWHVSEGFNADNYAQFKLFATPQKLLIIGDSYVTELDTAHRVLRQEKFSDTRIIRSQANIHTNGRFFTYFPIYGNPYFGKLLHIRSVQAPKKVLTIDITKIDTNYRAFAFQYEGNPDPGILTQDDRLFLPVVYSKNNTTFDNSYIQMLIFQLNSVGDSVRATLQPTRFLPILSMPLGYNSGPRFYEFTLLRPSDAYAYFQNQNLTYRINMQTGAYERVGELLFPTFGMRNDTTWAFGDVVSNNERQPGFAYQAPNQTTWTFGILGKDAYFDNHFFVGQYFIGKTRTQQLHTITPFYNSPQNAKIRALANNQLDFVQDMTYFNRRVYAATTQGLLYKSLEEFIVYPK